MHEEVNAHDRRKGAVKQNVSGEPKPREPLGDEMCQIPIKVEIYGTVRDLVRQNQVEVLLPGAVGATVRDVLEKLAERFGPDFRERLYAAPGRLGSVRVYLGGRSIANLDELLPSEEAQRVIRLIFLAVMGGG